MENDPTCITDGCTNLIKIKARRLCMPCYRKAWSSGQLIDKVAMGPRPSGRECSEDGCTNAHKAHGFCKKHLTKARSEGRAPANECDFDGCTNIRHIESVGLCLTHYRQQNAGKELTPIRKRQARTGQCAGPECTDQDVSKGLCGTHYMQLLAGKELTPIKRITVDLRGKPCKICVAYGDERLSYTSDGLCQTHARRRASEEKDWDRRIPQKAPNGAGHINEDGYRIITVGGRNVGEHRHFMEQLLGRPLAGAENVHHLNGNRADNRTHGPLRLVNGKLRSGNLELWSSAQPAGQEIGPKVEWALELLSEYAEFLTEDHGASLAVLARGAGHQG